MEKIHGLRARITKVPKPTSSNSNNLTFTPAERAKRYREQRKNDPVFKEKERLRKKVAWRQRTENKKERDKEQNRKNQERYRERQKMLGVEAKRKPSQVLTRSEREKKREYWRRKQQESRAKKHPQKIRRNKEKDRKTKRKQRLIVKVKAMEKQGGEYKNDKLKLRKAIFESIKENTVSRKRLAKKLAFLKKFRTNKIASTYLGISQSYFCKLSKQDENQPRKTRKDKTSVETQTKIENFFRQSNISTNLPDSKRIKVDMEERRVLDRTIKQTYREFKESCPTEISISTFAKLKPKNVETTKRRKWNACLCEICTNVELKIRSLSHLAAKCQSDVKIENKHEALEKTMCAREPNEKWHRKQCIKRQCDVCGIDGLVAFYNPLMAIAENRNIKYTKWERVTKIRKGKQVAQIMPKIYEKSATSVILDLANELEKLAEHLFVAAWQQNQFSRLLKTVPSNWVVLNMDFSENYSCLNQNEVQSAHWGHNTVTIHPTVAFYQCPEENCDDVIQEALIFVSDDGQHDAHAVAEFVSIANEHLQHVRGLHIEKEIQMTDGCSAQYKSKTPFTDVSFSTEDYGFIVERHFYGSRHGKGPSDGAGAVVKSGAKRSVMGMNCIINSAEDLFTFGKEKLENTEKKDDHTHHKRTFFLVNAIDRDRPNRSDTKTLRGTRKLQCIKSTGLNFTLFTRNLSCFCAACVNYKEDECENLEKVEQWDYQKLQRNGVGAETHQVRGHGHRNARGEVGRRKGARTRGGIRTRGGERGARTRGGERGARTRRGERVGLRIRGGERGARTRGRIRGARTRRERRQDTSEDDSDVSDQESLADVIDPDQESLADVIDPDQESLADVIDPDQESLADVIDPDQESLVDVIDPDQESLADVIDPVSPKKIPKMQIDYNDCSSVMEMQNDFVDCSSSDNNEMELSGLSEILLTLNEESEGDLSPKFPYFMSLDIELPTDQSNGPAIEDSIMMNPSPDVTDDPPTTVLSQSPDLQADLRILPDFTSVDHTKLSTVQSHLTEIDILSTDQSNEPVNEGSISMDMSLAVTDDPSATDDPPTIVVSQSPDHQADQRISPEFVNLTSIDHTKLSTDQSSLTEIDPLSTDQSNGPAIEDSISMNMSPAVTDDPSAIDDPPTTVLSQSPDLQADQRYNVGINVEIQHGQNLVPAVVVSPPDDELADTRGIWVQFYSKSRAGWMLDQKLFFVSHFDVVRCLEQPALLQIGSRFYYKFFL